MPDLDDVQDGKNYHFDMPHQANTFFLKGSNSLDWGMKNRLARIFNPASGKTVMLAVDHGYFQGPTTGLERIDVDIVPLVPYADALMITRGALRTSDSAGDLQAGGAAIERRPEHLEGALERAGRGRCRRRRSAECVRSGRTGVYRRHARARSIGNLVKVVDAGNRHGIPTLGVTAVGKELVRDAKYLGLATRICAEMGAHFVKTYYCEKGFARVAAACPVPVVIAGGKKLPELDALKMAYEAIDQGAAGVDMGRNIFQCEAPIAMIQAVRAVVHEHEKPDESIRSLSCH